MMTLKHALLGAAGALAILSGSAASAADFTAADMKISLGMGGTISASFGNSGIAAGAFTDTYTFRIPDNGFGSGSVITTATFLGGIDDTDLTSVFVNGIEATKSPTGLNEFAFVNGVPITANAFNTITINGVSRGNGSYGGSATFTPAVPEPASWALMIGGIGFAGGAVRYRRRATSVTFA